MSENKQYEIEYKVQAVKLAKKIKEVMKNVCEI